MELKNLKAPALGQKGLERLLAACAPSRMTSRSTLFDAGVEQFKRDIKEIIFAEVGIPDSDTKSQDKALRLSAHEKSARQEDHSPVPWWHRALK